MEKKLGQKPLYEILIKMAKLQYDNTSFAIVHYLWQPLSKTKIPFLLILDIGRNERSILLYHLLHWNFIFSLRFFLKGGGGWQKKINNQDAQKMINWWIKLVKKSSLKVWNIMIWLSKLHIIWEANYYSKIAKFCCDHAQSRLTFKNIFFLWTIIFEHWDNF